MCSATLYALWPSVHNIRTPINGLRRTVARMLLNGNLEKIREPYALISGTYDSPSVTLSPYFNGFSPFLFLSLFFFLIFS